MRKTKEERATKYSQWAFHSVVKSEGRHFDSFDIEKAFLQGWSEADKIADTEIAELKEQLRWRSVEEMPIPTYRNLKDKYLIKGHYKIGQSVGYETYETAYINKDVFEAFGEVHFDTPKDFVAIEWLPIPRKDLDK